MESVEEVRREKRGENTKIANCELQQTDQCSFGQDRARIENVNSIVVLFCCICAYSEAISIKYKYILKETYTYITNNQRQLCIGKGKHKYKKQKQTNRDSHVLATDDLALCWKDTRSAVGIRSVQSSN